MRVGNKGVGSMVTPREKHAFNFSASALQLCLSFNFNRREVLSYFLFTPRIIDARLGPISIFDSESPHDLRFNMFACVQVVAYINFLLLMKQRWLKQYL